MSCHLNFLFQFLLYWADAIETMRNQYVIIIINSDIDVSMDTLWIHVNHSFV